SRSVCARWQATPIVVSTVTAATSRIHVIGPLLFVHWSLCSILIERTFRTCVLWAVCREGVTGMRRRRRLLAPQPAEEGHVPPGAAPELGPPQDALEGEPGPQQRPAFGRVLDVGRRLHPLGPAD